MRTLCVLSFLPTLSPMTLIGHPLLIDHIADLFLIDLIAVDHSQTDKQQGRRSTECELCERVFNGASIGRDWSNQVLMAADARLPEVGEPMPDLERRDEPRLQAADNVVADLQLLLRGVVLPWRELGGAIDQPHSTASADLVLLRIPPALALRVQACGQLVITDCENFPVGRITDATVGHCKHGVWVQGRPEPCGAPPPIDAAIWNHSWTNDPDRPGVMVICQRPLLRAEVNALRSQADTGSNLLVVVPEVGVTPDHVPHRVLLRCLQADVPDLPRISLPIAWRDHDSDLALALAIASAARASSLQVLDSDEPRWHQLVSDLNHFGDSPTLNLVANGTWGQLTRWRPPRTRRGLVVFFTGLSGSGKSTLARSLVERIGTMSDRNVSLLDGDEVRRLLSSGLGFDRVSRDLNVQRIGFVAAEIARSGGIAVCAPIAPYAASRAAVRTRVAPVGDFVLVHVATPLEECELRDIKGLYSQARAGVITEFTGVSDPYEEPTDADLIIDTTMTTPDETVTFILEYLLQCGWLGAPAAKEESWTG